MAENDPSATSAAASVPTLPATLRLGPVHLIVSDLDRSLDFYTRALGLRLHRRDGELAALGDGSDDVLVLHGHADAHRTGRHAGLYHFCLLFPSRPELARASLRLAATGWPIEGASDHGTHEAIYLADPDGNGIELAADRPREVWPDMRSDPYAGRPQRLDIDDLLATAGGETAPEAVGPGLRVGHMHLTVGNIERGLAFYRDVIGFELVTRLPTAAFVSAGGYHHHVGFNVWNGEGVPPAPAGSVGLDHWTMELDQADDVRALTARLDAAGIAHEPVDGGLTVRDPWEIALRVVSAA